MKYRILEGISILKLRINKGKVLYTYYIGNKLINTSKYIYKIVHGYL
ncbi:hypothetical protein CFB3_38920 [Clostridium folliculivorans]|uniref:Uncharacterized protein n=1 Tax=Clostridium folliculivorans TaxID=2886038 RepID=A0A9W6DCW2_9CLOT|nr:hypothetical protein CFOLD11_39950 [Clostridium folliculivorans]GKU31785.1 hypothetical protein CFB3_38920 [Clostridium folliculivorans]